MNRKFFRVIGMSRSGIHAVADWIRMSHAEMGYTCHYDNAIPMERPNDIAKFLPPKGELSESFLWMVEHEDVHFLDMPVLNPKIASNFEFTDVLVIRDVFNTMASRRKMNERGLFSRRHIQQWKQFAFEALEQTSFLGPNKVVVKFNQWHQQRDDYRSVVAKACGIEGVGAESNKVVGHSSWEPNTTPASELKLFERWRNYAEDPAFWAVFDKQVYDLNSSLFGSDSEVLKFIK